MLEHAYAGDLVVLGGARHLLKIHQMHGDFVAQLVCFDQGIYIVVLLLGQGYAGGLHTVMRDRMHDEPTPAAANIEEIFTRLQIQFATNVIQFGDLGSLQAHIGILKICTGIDAARIEPQSVKIIRHIVMMLDILARIIFTGAPPTTRAWVQGGFAIATVTKAVPYLEDVTNLAVQIDFTFYISAGQCAEARIYQGLQTGRLVQTHAHAGERRGHHVLAVP